MSDLARISLAGIGTGDLAAQRRTVVAVDAALKEIGFFIVTDHGVPGALIDETVAMAHEFFDLPMAEKRAIASTVQGSPRGYVPYGLETLSYSAGNATPPDLKEGFGMGPVRVIAETSVLDGIGATYTPNRWPERPAGFRDTAERYYRAMEGLTERLMAVFAVAMDLPPRWFVERFADHNSTLRLTHYPPQETAPAPGQLRAGAHTDYGALTILLGQDRPGGLQVKAPNGTWIDVQTRQHDFVINIGDLMMTWSNDTWVSTPHRVANPPEGAGAAARRLSFAYFCNPNDALSIECLPACYGPGRPAKYPPIRAGEHRFRKIEASKQAMRGP